MFSNQINDIFRRSFEPFFLKYNMIWQNNAFVKSENGLFYYVFVDCEELYGVTDVDIVFLTLPNFGVNAEKMKKSSRVGLSFEDISEFEKNTIDAKVKELADVESLMNKYLELLERCFDKYFKFNSFTDYADKMLRTGHMIVEFMNGNSKAAEKLFHKFSHINFVNVCYYYMLENGKERCREFALELVGIYRNLLYDRIKDGDMADLSESFDRMVMNYNKITQFIEALIERNESYFAVLKQSFSESFDSSQAYIGSLLKD